MGTGEFLRVERDGKWQNIEVEYLYGDEMMTIFKGRWDDELIRWMDILAQRVRHYEQTLLYLEDEMKKMNFDKYFKKHLREKNEQNRSRTASNDSNGI